MKRFLVAALLAAGSVSADESPFLKESALAAEVARNCANGCLVLSPAEAQMMMNTINEKLQEREFAAFEAGKAAGKEIEKAYGKCRT